MANGSTDKNAITVLLDKYENVILGIGLSKYMLRQPNGSIDYIQRSSNIQLVDGPQWNPGMLLANPPIYVGVCDQCRYPPFSLFRRETPCHGICTLGRAKLCVDCGILCCPRHRKICSDQKWRCLTCNKTYKIKEWIRPIFFTRR